MLQLTKRTEYGLIALVHMVDREGEFVCVREISERYTIPRRLLAEVLKDLCHAGLVESHRGVNGGYSLSRSPDELSISSVVDALEGRPLVTSCDASSAARHTECGLLPTCPIRSPLHRIRESLWQILERTTLRSLVRHPSSVLAPTGAPALSSTAVSAIS